MTTIRSNPFSQTPQRPPGQDGGKLAAQRAFFNAALGQAQPSAPAAGAPAASAAPATAHRMAAAPADQGQKILRPGSLLDIRI